MFSHKGAYCNTSYILLKINVFEFYNVLFKGIGKEKRKRTLEKLFRIVLFFSLKEKSMNNQNIYGEANVLSFCHKNQKRQLFQR